MIRFGSLSLSRQTLICYTLLILLILAAWSYWLPWVDHATAALKLSGQDLGEFVKFIPAIRHGEVHLPRQIFYLPPLMSICALTLLGINRHMPFPRWLRVLLLALTALLLPGLLPPVWGSPRDWFTAEFRLQGLALIWGAGFILAHGLWRRIPATALGWSLASLSLIGLLPMLWGWLIARPLIWAVYNTPTIHLGWGLWLHTLAWSGTAVLAALLISTSHTSTH